MAGYVGGGFAQKRVVYQFTHQSIVYMFTTMFTLTTLGKGDHM